MDRQAALPRDAAAIERRSYEIIDRQLAIGARPIPTRGRSFAAWSTPRPISPSPARCASIRRPSQRGRAALAAGKPIVCDVKMLQAGMTKIRGEILCAIDASRGGRLGPSQGCTRAAAAMELLAPRLEGAIVAIGNAPTALWKVMELARHGGPRPALVVGLPVGLVGAREVETGPVGKRSLLHHQYQPARRQPGGGGGRQRPGHAAIGEES